MVEWMVGVWPGLVKFFWAVVALGFIIFAHEFGHFIVAKLSGVGVLKFSLGFGRKLLGFRRGETEYLISALPLGGYVKMVGEDEDGEELSPEDKARAFTSAPIWKRAAIVFAGPLFNIVLAVLLCYALFVTGFPEPYAGVYEVEPGSPAAAAGIRAGDVVETVDGQPVGILDEVMLYARDKPGKDISLKLSRGGEVIEATVVPAAGPDGKGELGLAAKVVIEGVERPSPADEAGIEPMDRVVAVGGVPVRSWSDMAGVIRDKPGTEIPFTVERGGRTLELRVRPAPQEVEEGGVKKTVGAIKVMRKFETKLVAYGPVESAGLALDYAFSFTKMIVVVLSRIIGGQESASNLGGPVAIVQMSGRFMDMGLAYAIKFMAFLSINLGVINLFPIPILDGGHLLFFGIEAAMGRPLSMRKRELAQQVGLFLLITLFVFVFYNDIMRLMGFLPMMK